MGKHISLRSVLSAAFISLSLTNNYVQATPFINKSPQQPFNLPNHATHESHKADRTPAMEYALKALSHASAQVIETFETVMAELDDVAKQLTWSLPKKSVRQRPDGWDYKVASAALPEHRLRVKKPNGLGVDDVKQVLHPIYI